MSISSDILYNNFDSVENPFCQKCVRLTGKMDVKADLFVSSSLKNCIAE